jgi:hypothetical protein
MVKSTRRGKFIDIEVFGGISVGGSMTGQDILSDNWDGSNPANLASVDAGASLGYYLDGSAGAAQFMGNLYVGGDIELSSTGVFKSAPRGTLPTWGEIAEDVVEAMPMVQHSYDENGDLGIHSRDSLAALGLLAIQDLRRRVKVLETA